MALVESGSNVSLINDTLHKELEETGKFRTCN